jgi:hypothetical protein
VRTLAADAYRPDQWHDFFITLGGAAAVLMGLVFVALSLNEVVVRDATHRYRAIGTLTNFAGIFVLCVLALMGDQNHVAVGTEWLLVSSAACAVYVYIAGVAMVTIGVYSVSGAWLLLVGAYGDQHEHRH